MGVDAGRLGLVLTVGLVTYATRLVGLQLGERTLPPALDRFLAYVPIAVFATLIAPGLADGSGALTSRLVGAAVAAGALLWLGKLWVGLAAGMVGFWLAEAVAS